MERATADGPRGCSFDGEEDDGPRPVLQLAHTRLGPDKLVHSFRGRSRFCTREVGNTPTLIILQRLWNSTTTGSSVWFSPMLTPSMPVDIALALFKKSYGTRNRVQVVRKRLLRP